MGLGNQKFPDNIEIDLSNGLLNDVNNYHQDIPVCSKVPCDRQIIHADPLFFLLVI